MNDMDNREAKEQLAFIKSVMDDSQKVLADNGDGFILWGVLMILAGVSSYFLDQFELNRFQGWLYLGIVGIGWIYMLTLHRKTDKSIIGNPLTKKIIDSIWIAVLATMTLLGFVGGASQAINLDHMTAVMYTVLGIAYFLQGVITGKVWVRNLAFGWWGGSIILFFLTHGYAGILAIVMMIGLQIIPGFIFRRQWKAHFSED
ncbi:MAG: hypothetical protein HOD43_05510 [Candidatus Marinimicrobia bacterium]|jgi:hypothetical protein|nr:hypothetical protein [Candidatus Neomarinimicrobiota bacterium]MBT3632563.1 hypothetical protein [Candidatus Neomarinimicrobiota bacterium]MBT3824962.1 hypothetical protein [Candidatus Neomarinimicrobiota bacterium]MBT4129122.1 hypothetical protein [Candidatus Neomarinimicrobiota bacterium]MBT4295247.1 hypothetical protein [Candidatus Neomarinimicrobiota bacterium]